MSKIFRLQVRLEESSNKYSPYMTNILRLYRVALVPTSFLKHNREGTLLFPEGLSKHVENHLNLQQY